ncbi:MAG: DUF6089 family protein [Saprospiraceae bacterium]|nr:DUF6089 family protein [Saprospiraceae bacterium]
MRNTILSLLAICIPMFAYGQTPQPWEIGAGTGLGAYDGELQNAGANPGSLELKPSFSAHLRYNLRNNFAARLGFLYSGLSGDDQNFQEPAWHKTRAFSFEGPVVELSLQAELYPFGLYKAGKRKKSGLSKNRKLVAPFVSVGIGGAFFQPKNNWNDANDHGGVSPSLIQTDIIEAKNASMSIPMGLGFRFRISNRFTLGLESALRYTTGDYLDGISLAGNPATNDWFYTAQLTASYAFGDAPGSGRRRSDAEDQPPPVDTDSDGVSDEKDDCPEIPGLRSLRGCPDADHDGVPDNTDQCPQEPGLPTAGGCPDRDEDGIADKDDNCPDLKGVVAYRGCPAIDRDKDGVADAEDLCPDMSGQLRWKGCPDSDGDGLPDNKDGCPGIAGPENLRGCPDTDGDGIADKDDECPTMPGLAEKNGCPETMPIAPGVPYKAIYFNSTLDDWQVTSLITIEEIVAIMNADPTLYARVEGHTDNTGREPANDLLAEKRAKRCLDNLVSKGIAVERLNYIGFGSRKPTVLNDTRENRQLNRRVEVHFYRK